MLTYLKSNPRFLRYLIALWASELGDNIRNYALMFVILDQQGSHSSMAIALNLFCEYAPICVFGFVIGVFADRWDRKRTVMGAIFGRAMIMLLIIVAIELHSLLLLYTCSFFSAIGTVLFRAAQGGFTMLFIEREDRALAAGLRQMAISMLALIGPAIATFCYTTIGGGATLGVTAGLFLLGIALLSTIRVPSTAAIPSAEKRTLSSIGRDLRDGFRYAKNHRTLRLILQSNLLFGIAAGIMNTLGIFVLTEYYGMPKELVSVIAPFQGIGMMISSTLFTKWKIRSELLVPLSLLIISIGMVGYIFPKNFYVSIAGSVIAVMGVVANNIGTSTLFQTRIDFEYQGRSNVITQACWMGTMVIMMPFCGWLHNVISIIPLFFGGGAVMLLGAILLYLNILRVPLHDVAAEPLKAQANA